MTPAFRFDSDLLAPEERLERYRAMAPAYAVTSLVPEPAFRATAEAWLVGTMLFSVTRVGPLLMMRDARRVESDGLDHYSFMFTRFGAWTGDFDGLAAGSGPGAVTVMDAARPSAARSESAELVRVMMSRDQLDGALAPFDMHGLRLEGGAGGLVRDHIDAVLRRLPDLPDRAAFAVESATRDLIAAALELHRPAEAATRLNRTVLARARGYVATHMDQPIDVEALSQALGVSRASLYRAFEPLGGVATYIQRRRLARIHALLSRPEETRSISQLAYAYGFTNGEHFSRRFRRQYGYSASAVRLAARPAPAPVETEAYDPGAVLQRFRDLG